MAGQDTHQPGLRKRQQQRRFDQIWYFEKFKIGDAMDRLRDTNKAACRAAAGEKAACAWNNYTQESGVDFFGFKLTKGMDDQIKDILSRIDESWLSDTRNNTKERNPPLEFSE